MRKMPLSALVVGLVTALQPAAHAQFGSGIVFDPTQSGHAIVQIEHEEQSISNQMQQIENGQQIFSNTVKIASTALQTYNQIKQQYNLYHEMMVAPQLLYERFLSPTTDLMMTQQIANHYGNGSGSQWVNSSNTGAAAAASIQLASIPPLTATIPTANVATFAGQQQLAAQGATVDLGDSVAATELETIGTIKANQTARQADITALENATNTTDPSQESEMAVLQRINRALLLQLRTMQDANQINANAALQQMVAQKQQQDAMKSAFRDSAGYESFYNANITTTSSGAANLLIRVGTTRTLTCFSLASLRPAMMHAPR